MRNAPSLALTTWREPPTEEVPVGEPPTEGVPVLLVPDPPPQPARRITAAIIVNPATPLATAETLLHQLAVHARCARQFAHSGFTARCRSFAATAPGSALACAAIALQSQSRIMDCFPAVRRFAVRNDREGCYEHEGCLKRRGPGSPETLGEPGPGPTSPGSPLDATPSGAAPGKKSQDWKRAALRHYYCPASFRCQKCFFCQRCVSIFFFYESVLVKISDRPVFPDFPVPSVLPCAPVDGATEVIAQIILEMTEYGVFVFCFLVSERVPAEHAQLAFFRYRHCCPRNVRAAGAGCVRGCRVRFVSILDFVRLASEAGIGRLIGAGSSTWC